MATKKGIAKLVQALRVGGCHNGQIDQDGALGIILEDWFIAFQDVTDDQLREAARAWCDKPRDGRGFKPWPITADLREMLQGLRAAQRDQQKPAACIECDYTGWRQLLRVSGEGKRLTAAAPCDCPRGAKMTNPPPIPANYPGPRWAPPEGWRTVVEKWERQGYEVHHTSARFPVIPLSLSNPEAWERAQNAAQSRGMGAFGALLEKLKAGAPPNPRDVKRESAADLDEDPDAWRGEAPF
jgi:hypothetical protein